MRLHLACFILANLSFEATVGCGSNPAAPAGADGTAGSGSGTAGAAGVGTSGSAGSAGASGSVGTAGASGGIGSAGTAGASGNGGVGTAGASGTAGSAGASGSVGTAGASGNGSAGTAGANGTAGAGGCAATDQNGKSNWSPGASTSATQDYLRMCDIRLINNNWGSAAFGCNTPMSVYVNSDGSFGWSFNRGNCDTANTNQKPDFPEIEFGDHPFGAGNALATTPDFSSTTLLPLQIKDIQSASVALKNMTIALQASASWDLTFELWLSQRNPITDPNPGVYAELMTFWGWQNGRYPEPPNGTGPVGTGAGDQVTAGKTYKLEVQSDTWANGQWRYFQFRATDGPQTTFNGTVDVRKLLDYLVNTRGYSSDYWVTRFEVGSEIDDLTQGTVSVQGVTFEVNGQTRSAGK